MTTVYFVRHAKPNFENHDDLSRELSLKGLEDRKLVTKYLDDKDIDIVLSSPYKRAVDTIKHFADAHNLKIQTMENFRERCVGGGWIDNFGEFCKKQWEDFDYKFSDGENLREVQERNVTALLSILEVYQDKNIVIGSHGTALSVIINYFDPSFGYSDFDQIKNRMPWVVRFSFQKMQCVGIEKVNILS